MNHRFLKKNLLILLLITLLALGGCAFGKEKIAYGTLASGYLNELSSMGARPAGTDAEIAAGDWIAEQLTKSGYEVTRQPFLFKVGEAIFDSENIIAEKPGESEETVLVGAHYDSADVGKGVDDNGSGVALLLETADLLKDVETPQTLEFIFFGAEEIGFCGSDYYATHMSASEVKNTLLMVNFDSIVAGDNAYVYGDAGKKGKFRDRALEIAEDNDLTLVTQPGRNKDFPAGTTGDFSDHAPFRALGIPYVYFESTNWTLGNMDGYTQAHMKFGEEGDIWHTKFDNLTYLNKSFPGRIEERLSTFSNVTNKLLREDLSEL